MKRYLRLSAALLALAALLTGCGEETRQKLPALGAKIDDTSVSGVSSGAYMAGQFEMAHSRDVIGAALIAGGPYGCSESLFANVMPGPGSAIFTLTKAINGCMLNALSSFGVPNPQKLADRAGRLAEKDRIDPVSYVQDDRIYLFSGKDDHTVVPAIVTAARDYYKALGVPDTQIQFVSDLPAGHGFVTEDKGPACGYTGKPYIVDCGYDQAGALLAHIYGPLNPRANEASGVYLVFDQSALTHDIKNHGLSSSGLIYMPKACLEADGCRVHIAFHGCGQNQTFVGDAFAHDTGFARWADTNNIIVLFPQTATTPLNPQGCWDWWGYTGRRYLTRAAPQINAVRRMLEQLAGSRSST